MNSPIGRRLLLTGVSAFAIFAGPEAEAVSLFNFGFTGAVETRVVDEPGTYAVSVGGARGGDFTDFQGAPPGFGYTGGTGALVTGTLYLGLGTSFDVLVGGYGTNAIDRGALGFYGAGGGGGLSYFRTVASLAVAGGGGGGGRNSVGGDGQAGPNGQAGYSDSGSYIGGAGGTGGSGGGFGNYGNTFYSGGGAGISGDGGTSPTGSFIAGGGSTGPSWAGGTGADTGGNGGFGGGGGGSDYAGGGGGGYSGGGGGGGFLGHGGGGGGSYLSSLFQNPLLTAGGAVNGAYVRLELIEAAPATVPLPGTLGLIGSAVAGLILAGRRRRG